MSTTKRGRKQDKNLVCALQDHELDTIVRKMKKEGIKVSRQEVRDFTKVIHISGHANHEQVYAVIRERFKEGTLISQADVE